jgi:methionine-rich copper-binding protein CopC
MQPSIRVRRSLRVVAAVAFALLSLPGLVAAHAELVTPSPADKAVSPPISEVSGLYSEAMTPNGSSILVKDATGATVMQGTVDAAKNTRMVAHRVAPLGAGAYTVAWTSVALDGHIERGTWTFTVAASAPSASTPAAPSAAASSAAASQPAGPSAQASASNGPTAIPSAAGGTTGSGTSDVLLPIIVALIILGAGAAYLLSRRGRPTDLG